MYTTTSDSDCYQITTTDSTYTTGYYRYYNIPENYTTINIIQQNEKENNKIMNIYEAIIVDKKECEILKVQKVIAKDRETAMLELEITPEIKGKIKKDQVEFIFTELGSFEKLERTIKVKDLEDE